MRTRSWLFFFALVTAPVPVTQGQQVSLTSLLSEMTDRDRLARLPSPRYTCRQFSSYDRASTTPDDHDSWFANDDRNQFIRVEERDGRSERVMMDAQGPGAITRFWATWTSGADRQFSNGVLRVYLDGADEPAIEGPLQSVIDQGLLAGPPLSQSVSPEAPYANRGHNLYLPIPYAESCKVTYTADPQAEDGEVLYYQINYRTYPAETQVESFSMDRLAAAKEALESTQQQLLAPDEESTAGASHPLDCRLAAGESSQPVQIEGPAAIAEISLRLEADDMPQAMRSTVLRIEFDGEPTIWAPVGDFFGAGYLPAPHETWYTTSHADGQVSCRWVMPFGKSAKVSLENVGNQPVEVVAAAVKSAPWQWDDRSMHFHATWREYNRLETRRGSHRAGEGAFDVNYVEADGHGVYVGDVLTIFNGAAKWWGEGDEKIYVDGESFPSHFGTGTEDYYGYAWCRAESFSAPFHAQPDGGGNLKGGYSVNSRFRALDAIPFRESIRFDMENWHWHNTHVNYAPTTFFYARPGAKTNAPPAPEAAAERVVLDRSELVALARVPGAVEGEDLKILAATGGKTRSQTSSNWDWSGEEQLWWVDPAVGDELTLGLPDSVSTAAELELGLTIAPDYARVEVSVNGRPLPGGLVDLYHHRVLLRVQDFGEVALKPTGNVLTFRIVGRNEKAAPRNMVGIDYVKLTPVAE